MLSERATGLGRRTREERERYIYREKWDQTGSPEIPEKGETSEIPRPPFGVVVLIKPGRLTQIAR